MPEPRKKPLALGSCALGKVPRVVAVVDHLLPIVPAASLMLAGVDIFEVRVDLIKSDFQRILKYVTRLRRSIPLPLIGTIRETEANKNRRFDMFRRIMPLLDCVDIEIDSAINQDVIAWARKTRTAVIVSEHDFNGTPDLAGLRRIVRTAVKQGADIVKIAAMANKPADVTRLMNFCKKSTVPLVVISMGEVGAVSRIEAPSFGSLLTYGCIGKPVAPGQLSVRKLIDELRRRYPKLRR